MNNIGYTLIAASAEVTDDAMTLYEKSAEKETCRWDEAQICFLSIAVDIKVLYICVIID